MCIRDSLETLHKELARFNPEAPLTMLFDYVKIRFPTLDIQHIIKDILKLNINYMLHEEDVYKRQIISMPLRAEGESKGKAFLGGVLSGVVEPIGAVLTLSLIHILLTWHIRMIWSRGLHMRWSSIVKRIIMKSHIE